MEEDTMRRKSQMSWTVLLLVLVLVLVAAVGCGGSSSSSSGGSSSPAATGDLTADQIVQQSAEKMKDVKSAAMTADVALEVQGDASKMTDPTQKAMLSQGLSLHLDGKSQTDPMAADMKVSVGLAGQTIDLGVIADGDTAYVEYQGKYYKVDQKNTKSVTDAAGSGLSPMDQLKKQGLDIDKWGVKYELLGTEDMNGAQVYHVKATVDTKAMVADLMKQMSNPDLGAKLGDPATAKQLQQGLAQNKAQIDELSNSVKAVTGDYWYAVDTLYLTKATWNVALDTKGLKDMQGVDGMTMKADLTMSGFNEPVTVSPPAKSLPFDKLMNQMFGGMMGGSTSGLGI
jgi:hypothetical protein